MTDLSILEHHEEAAERTVAEAMKAYQNTVTVLRRAVEKFEAEYEKGEEEVLKDLKAMNSAFFFAVQSEAKARDAIGKQGTAAEAGALDLDGARDEIRLRLACLRSACDD